MRNLIVIAIFLLAATGVVAQQPREWIRVYTFEDSIVEMNTVDVARIGEGQARVTFRQTYRGPQVLAGKPGVKFDAELDLFEFDCANRQYRPHAVFFLNAAGTIVHHQGADARREWKRVASETMPGRYLSVACGEIARQSSPKPAAVGNETVRTREAAALAGSFWRRMARTRDIAPLLDDYFAADFTDRMLGERSTDWLAKLSPQTAARLSRNELRSYYAAVINAQFLGSLYVIAKAKAGADPSAPGEQVVSPTILQLVDHHPYSTKYGNGREGYGYLSEPIESLEQARSYTDMLERTNDLLHRELGPNTPTWFRPSYISTDHFWEEADPDLTPAVSICERECFGLPAGTRLYVTNLPLMRVQMAVIRGRLRIVSAAVTTAE